MVNLEDGMKYKKKNRKLDYISFKDMSINTLKYILLLGHNLAIEKLVDSEHNYDFLPITYKDVNGKDWDGRYYQRIQSKGV